MNIDPSGRVRNKKVCTQINQRKYVGKQNKAKKKSQKSQVGVLHTEVYESKQYLCRVRAQ